MKPRVCRLALPVAVAAGLLMYSGIAWGGSRGVAVEYTAPPGGQGGLEGTVRVYNRSFAVVIGIDAYQSPDVPKLTGAVRDARNVAAELTKQGFEVKVLLNEKANGARIREVLGDELPNQIGPEDRVLVYYAGHGVSTGEGDAAVGYLVPVDGSRARPRSRGISMTELTGWFNEYKSKHVMFVADACYSGLALSTRAMGLSPALADYLRQITNKRVRMVMTAGGSGQEANEYEGEGLFTRFFLEAIRGSADSDHDGIVTSAEIEAYVKPGVAQAALTYLRAEQTPLVGRRGEGEFVFLTRRSAPSAAVAPKPRAQAEVPAPIAPRPRAKPKVQARVEPKPEPTPEPAPSASAALPESVGCGGKEGTMNVVVMETAKGTIKFTLLPQYAPATVTNFCKLVQKRFYDGLTFHRIVPGFVIQGGDPAGNGSGGPGWTIKGEFSERKHLLGTVAMARTPDPNSAGSQFYICLDALPSLDRQYATFGQVFEGIEVVQKIVMGDKMTKVTVAEVPTAEIPEAARN